MPGPAVLSAADRLDDRLATVGNPAGGIDERPNPHIVEGAIGFTKVIGLIVGNSALQEEGKAQVNKASNQLEAAGKEAQADKARAQAKVQESRQKAASKAE